MENSIMKTKPGKAFTLLELLVAIAIVAILAGIASPNYFNYTKKAKFSSVLLLADAMKTKLILKCSTRKLNSVPKEQAMNSVPRAMHVAYEQLALRRIDDGFGGLNRPVYNNDGPIPGCNLDLTADFNDSPDIESVYVMNGVLIIKTTGTFDGATLIMRPIIEGGRISWAISGTACEKGYVHCDTSTNISQRIAGSFTDSYMESMFDFYLSNQFIKNYDTITKEFKDMTPDILSWFLYDGNPFKLTDEDLKNLGFTPLIELSNETEESITEKLASIPDSISKEKLRNYMLLRKLGIKISDEDFGVAEINRYKTDISELVSECGDQCDIDSLINNIVNKTFVELNNVVSNIVEVSGRGDNAIPLTILLGEQQEFFQQLFNPSTKKLLDDKEALYPFIPESHPLNLLLREKHRDILSVEDQKKLAAFKQTDAYNIFIANNGLQGTTQADDEIKNNTKQLVVSYSKLNQFSGLLSSFAVLKPAIKLMTYSTAVNQDAESQDQVKNIVKSMILNPYRISTGDVFGSVGDLSETSIDEQISRTKIESVATHPSAMNGYFLASKIMSELGVNSGSDSDDTIAKLYGDVFYNNKNGASYKDYLEMNIPEARSIPTLTEAKEIRRATLKRLYNRLPELQAGIAHMLNQSELGEIRGLEQPAKEQRIFLESLMQVNSIEELAKALDQMPAQSVKRLLLYSPHTPYTRELNELKF